MMKKIKIFLFRSITQIINKFGWDLVRKNDETSVSQNQQQFQLDDRTLEYLSTNNPRLQTLIDRYAQLNPALTNSHVWNWKENPATIGFLRNFRGDTAYVWQMKGSNLHEMRYLLTTYYHKTNDKLNLLNLFKDDAAFGNHLYEIGGQHISREILDSSNEINFLEEALNLSGKEELSILDIGAGYGRLAHRFCQALPNIANYYCTDAVPTSTFISEFYLRFRKVDKARVVEMPSVETDLPAGRIHLAINIHSFSECTLEAIEWWIKLVSKLGVPYLFIVPNAFEEGGAKLLTNKREDFTPVLRKHNYALMKEVPKYKDKLVQMHALYPTHYFLFEKQ